MTKTDRKRLFARLLICILTVAILACVPVSAEGEADPASERKMTLSAEQAEKLGELIKTAPANKSTKMTPRSDFTEAYLNLKKQDNPAKELEKAREIIKKLNESVKEKDRVKDVKYGEINEADVEELINLMKDKIDLEKKPSGFVATIQLAAGSVLRWMTGIVGGNYVLGLLFFAVVLELLLLPVAIKQQKNSIKQAGLQPMEHVIRKKYAGRTDKVTQQKMAAEIQEMYQKEGFNPASGCLPMILQMAVILILYQVVINPLLYVIKSPVELTNALTLFANASEGAGGMGLNIQTSRGTIEVVSKLTQPGVIDKLRDFVYFSNGQAIVDTLPKLKDIPDFFLFGMDLGLVPSLTKPSWLWLIPIFTFISYFGSMKLTRKMTYQPQVADKATGCSNNIMDITMPLFSVYICFIVPAALGIYWIFKSILGTLTRFILTKAMPIPHYSDEEMKNAEKLIQATAEAERRPSGKPVRSLHRIDDEDFEDTRQAALERKAKIEKQMEEERAAEEAAAKRRAESGLIKNENDRPMLSLKELKARHREAKQRKAKEKREETARKPEDEKKDE